MHCTDFNFDTRLSDRSAHIALQNFDANVAFLSLNLSGASISCAITLHELRAHRNACDKAIEILEADAQRFAAARTEQLGTLSTAERSRMSDDERAKFEARR